MVLKSVVAIVIRKLFSWIEEMPQFFVEFFLMMITLFATAENQWRALHLETLSEQKNSIKIALNNFEFD